MKLRPFYDFEWWERFSLAGPIEQIELLDDAVSQDSGVSREEVDALSHQHCISYEGTCIVEPPFPLERRHLHVLFISYKVFAQKPDDRSLLWLLELHNHLGGCFVLTDGQDWPAIVAEEREVFAQKYPFIVKWQAQMWDTDKVLRGYEALQQDKAAHREQAS